ncbi:hypothetical protein AMTR_s00051p00024550 [Amborella trichopoda]|uniref:Uncharacterized protein n=1 Tax=Amborella trichopoda TaxID=13333 RepID=U5D2G4_AMBTC|nr:hypothetical protein AMTR_s00051p00024550 [Amborella trichopoda]
MEYDEAIVTLKRPGRSDKVMHAKTLETWVYPVAIWKENDAHCVATASSHQKILTISIAISKEDDACHAVAAYSPCSSKDLDHPRCHVGRGCCTSYCYG